MKMELSMSYNLIKVRAIDTSLGFRFHKIKSLKSYYEFDIDSPREMDRVKDVEGLINLLEKRALISAEKIDKLYLIFCCLQIDASYLTRHQRLIDRAVLKRKQENPSVKSDTEISNKFAADKNQKKFPPSNNANFNAASFETRNLCCQTCKQVHLKLPEEVVNVVCSEIGKDWFRLNNFLHAIKVPEMEKMLSDKRTSDDDKARKVITAYERNVEPAEINWRFMKAIRKLERERLYVRLEKIFLRVKL